MKTASPSHFLLFALLLGAAACDRTSTVRPEYDPAGSAAPPSNRIDIPASVRSNLGITFAKVERRTLRDALRVPGAFELRPLARHEYRLMHPAQIRFEVDEFTPVTPGTVLYRFLSPSWAELQARINLATTATGQSALQLDALQARVKALAAADFKRADLESETRALQAELANHQAELAAALTAATHLLNSYRDPSHEALAHADLLAPVPFDGGSIPRYQTIHWIEAKAAHPGIVESIATTDGAFAAAGSLVLTTIDPTQLRFRALALQGDLAKIHDMPTAHIVPHQSAGAGRDDSLEATLILGLTADPAQRTITLFADPQSLLPWARPGVSAFLEISPPTEASPVLAIPRSAVVKDGITHVFFKRDPASPNRAIRVEADLGIDDGRWVEVKSGIGPDDEVVLHGAYELKLATSTSGTSQKGGHFHADGTFHADDH